MTDIVERLSQWAENDMRAEDVALAAKHEIERLREALTHILLHCKSDTPPNAEALMFFINKTLGKNKND